MSIDNTANLTKIDIATDLDVGTDVDFSSQRVVCDRCKSTVAAVPKPRNSGRRLSLRKSRAYRAAMRWLAARIVNLMGAAIRSGRRGTAWRLGTLASAVIWESAGGYDVTLDIHA